MATKFEIDKQGLRICFVCKRGIPGGEKAWFDDIADAPVCANCINKPIDYRPHFREIAHELFNKREEFKILRELAEAVCGWRIHYEQKYPEELRIADRFDDWRELKEGEDGE